LDTFYKHTARIKDIYQEKIEIIEPFLDFAGRFVHMPGTVLLASGGDLDCARYNILAVKPWLSFSGRNRSYKITIDDQVFDIDQHPFDILQIILNVYRKNNQTLFSQNSNMPIQAGLFGYFSYDLKDCLEELPRTSVDDLLLPHICLFAPSIIFIQDRKAATTTLCIPVRENSTGYNNLQDDMAFFQKALSEKPNPHTAYQGNNNGFTSNFKKPRYLKAVEQIKEYIASGHIYQTNLSQRFHMDFSGDTFSLFKTLFKNNPAPFFSYINAGDHQILSTSPERFLHQQRDRVETRPIKGTRPRGKTPGEDKALGRELQQSKKDDAELSMIVDLLRNDLGKVCKAGTVKVAKHKMLEAYQNVFHLVSIVEGVLADDKSSADLIRACFPGGSITGCPKIRAMEIIDELEPSRRHIYTGSIGYISFHDTMDLSIAIRTATVYKNKIIFSVGGGIVFDSDPEDEFDETLHKGQTLMKAFTGKKGKQLTKNYAWINGSIESLDQAGVPISDMGLLYGYGFFETIRVNKGEIKLFDAHMERFNKSWKALFSTHIPDISWNQVIQQVISKNNLTEKVSAVKIIATRGDQEQPPYNHSLIVLAKPYEHRLSQKKKPGLDITVYPEPRQTPLAGHKTLNYLYYYLAGKWAQQKGFDEAIILNPDESISETNTANVLLIQDKTVFKPISPHALPGVMENAICELLLQWGYSIEYLKITTKDCIKKYQVVLTNSLMGAAPVLSIDGEKLIKSTELCKLINQELL
jgi:para-aminobenzoate synthetase component 1